MYQQKLSLPATCPILALIGLALGATSRRDGKLAARFDTGTEPDDAALGKAIEKALAVK